MRCKTVGRCSTTLKNHKTLGLCPKPHKGILSFDFGMAVKIKEVLKALKY